MISASFSNRYTQVPPREAEVWKTPMFEQYWKIKEGAPGALLFYRMGDFYELFGEDAVKAAPLLEVQLTARDKGAEVPVPMCGVPVHAWESYAERLVSAGLKVALCEQLSDSQAPGPNGKKSKLVERGVVRILTPGLPVDFKNMDGKAPHWLLSLSPRPSGDLDVLAFDFLSAALHRGTLKGALSLAELLSRLSPREILVPASFYRDPKLAQEFRLLGEQSAWYSVITPWTSSSAQENLEDYLLYTQRCKREELTRFLPEARPLADISGDARPHFARLPSEVLEQWAIFPELFELLDGSGSCVGSRRLRQMLSEPLQNVSRIQIRQRVLGSLEGLDEINRCARESYDFERQLGRFRARAADVKELPRFLYSLQAMTQTLETAGLLPRASQAWRELLESENLPQVEEILERLRPLVTTLTAALELNVEAAQAKEASQIIKAGFDAELDRLRELAQNGSKWIQEFEQKLKKESGIPSLKLRFNRVFGFFIEVTKAHLDKVPSHFERKQTIVGGERFTSAELRAKEAEILSAQALCEARAKELLIQLESLILSHDESLRKLVAAFSFCDSLAGLKRKTNELKRFGAWTFPEFSEGPFRFNIVNGRHPIIESTLENFTPNSLSLGEGEARLLLLTGPNMAGKSTLMRQCGIALLLAQCGFPVPAEKMSLTPARAFYSRMGASDRILLGESTFMVEMKESAEILREATPDSFILIDEIGRGTSNQDGFAIARAVLEYLVHNVGALSIFATHYHELSKVAAALPQAKNASMAIREEKGTLHFLRSLVFEAAESSYGIYVAKLAGLPKAVLARAEKLFKEEALVGTLGSSKGQDPRQLDIFAATPLSTPQEPAYSPAIKSLLLKISALDAEALSPRQAWQEIDDLIRMRRELSREIDWDGV